MLVTLDVHAIECFAAGSTHTVKKVTVPARSSAVNVDFLLTMSK